MPYLTRASRHMWLLGVL